MEAMIGESQVAAKEEASIRCITQVNGAGQAAYAGRLVDRIVCARVSKRDTGGAGNPEVF
jgi:hypothetical protein